MNIITYKGYIAKIEPDINDGVIVGRVINTRDIIGFHGETIAEAVKSFHAVIEEYLEDCKQRNIEPNKHYSGKLNLRISPKLHSAIVAKAAKANKSLNKWVSDALDQTVHVV